MIHLRRKDRALDHVDMQTTIKIPNHKRYNGWFDVTLGGNWLFAPARTVEAVPQGGSPIYRLGTNNSRVQYDIAIIVKAYAWCFDKRTPFQPVDVKDATACLAIGGGLSIAHPLRTFYPLGASLQLGQFFSAHMMLSLNRFDGLATGHRVGDVYSGDPGDVPSRDRYVLGLGFGFGVDPTLFATLLKGLVTGR
ncbi:MAG: hypothetical protein KF819_38075 [Labilithrix sp.]|nr:hypothetical protein [Labilithrix sp.]